MFLAITELRLGGFSWIFLIGLLQMILVSLLVAALFIFLVSVHFLRPPVNLRSAACSAGVSLVKASNRCFARANIRRVHRAAMLDRCWEEIHLIPKWPPV